MKRHHPLRVIGLLAALWPAIALSEEPRVRLMRVPDGGIQPQVVTDRRGTVHLIYFKGEARAGDVFYVFSRDGGRTFSKPLRVNSQEGSVIAIGTMRGAQLAVGKGGRAHVSWMGSSKAQPRGPGGEGVTPMLYARLNDAGDAFEDQRNLIQEKAGLDGGGSVAADVNGHVFVAWHAPSKRQGDEADRRVWLAVSTDDGKTFAKEQPISPAGLGACGCCGMRLFSTATAVYGLFRSARESVHRDMYLISNLGDLAKAQDYAARNVAPWKTGTCPASTAAFAPENGGALAAWESNGQVRFIRIRERIGLPEEESVAPPGRAGNRKHPAVAADQQGNVLMVWSVGVRWEKGGDVGWQVFDSTGKPLPGKEASGQTPGLPVWSLPSAFFDGKQFVVLY